jgi:hypothetical protein
MLVYISIKIISINASFYILYIITETLIKGKESMSVRLERLIDVSTNVV